MTRQHRFVVMGTGGLFTFYTLKTLLEQSCLPLAYIQSGSKPVNISARFADIELHFPQLEDKVYALLKSRSIPYYHEDMGSIETLIQKLDAEYLLVACWPRLLAQTIIASVSIAALNLHPSLLPKYRGFDPVEDQLETGDPDFGISLHLLNEHFDAGDIVLQQGFSISSPTPLQINKKAAVEGAKLFIRAVNTFHHPGWTLTPQHLS